jgi:hypothetical protein
VTPTPPGEPTPPEHVTPTPAPPGQGTSTPPGSPAAPGGTLPEFDSSPGNPGGGSNGSTPQGGVQDESAGFTPSSRSGGEGAVKASRLQQELGAAAGGALPFTGLSLLLVLACGALSLLAGGLSRRLVAA